MMLPCPFCGASGKYLSVGKIDGDDAVRVYCESCDCFGPDAGGPSEAVERWNKRQMVKMLREYPALAEAVKATYHAAASLVRYTGLSDEIYPRQGHMPEASDG